MSGLAEALLFDEKGFLPFTGESLENFLRRVAHIVDIAEDSVLRARIINRHIRSPRFARFAHQKGIANISLGGCTQGVAIRFRKGLAYFRNSAQTDLSWVPIVTFSSTSWWLGEGILGAVRYAAIGEKNDPYLPFFLVNLERPIPLSGQNTGVHEAFHLVRIPIRCGEGIALYGSEEFDHLGALMRRKIPRFLPFQKTRIHFLFGCLTLWYYFGNNAFYVLTRLAYDELVECILSSRRLYGTPPQFLKTFASRQLRFQIICEKLGL